MPEERDAGKFSERGMHLVAIVAAGVVVIGLVFFAMFSMAYLVGLLLRSLTGMPCHFDLPFYVRLVGATLAGVGASFIVWVWRIRKPKDIIVSTWITIRKLVRRERIEETSGRTEPFLPLGPYHYVRNPIYFGAVAILFGAGVASGSIVVILWSIFMMIWFWFILIPFEERELALVFKDSYLDYRRQVPKLFPYGRRYGVRPAPTGSSKR